MLMAAGCVWRSKSTAAVGGRARCGDAGDDVALPPPSPPSPLTLLSSLSAPSPAASKRLGACFTIPRHAPALSRGTASFFSSLGESLASPSSPSPSYASSRPYASARPLPQQQRTVSARRTGTVRVAMPDIDERQGSAGAAQAQAQAQASIGEGSVRMPEAYGAISAGGVGGGPEGALPVAVGPSRTHYRLTRREVLRGVANRFVHSTAYLYFYGGMALASTLTVVISLWQPCPGVLFYAMELAINACLIAEVGVRGVAFGKQFWKSTYNIVDLFLVLLCALTLAVLFFSHDCSPYRGGGGSSSSSRSGRGEELLDSLLLIVRNGAQLIRLLSVVRRSGSNVASRVPAIDLNAARGFSLDIDLEDEGEAARQRMRNGGWHAEQGAWGGGEERTHLFEADEEEDEL